MFHFDMKSGRQRREKRRNRPFNAVSFLPELWSREMLTIMHDRAHFFKLDRISLRIRRAVKRGWMGPRKPESDGESRRGNTITISSAEVRPKSSKFPRPRQ